jgi:thioredoxin-like negative regulator of GroEL
VNGLANEYGGWVDVYYYNTDDPANYEVISQYGVQGLPTTIILDGSGSLANRLAGFTSADQLRTAINQAISR